MGIQHYSIYDCWIYRRMVFRTFGKAYENISPSYRAIIKRSNPRAISGGIEWTMQYVGVQSCNILIVG